jgi:hypothetical protein
MGRAENLWPEFQGNRSALIRKILADWDHIRNEKGGRTERLEKRMDQHDRLLKLICVRLDIDTGDDHNAPNSDSASV